LGWGEMRADEKFLINNTLKTVKQTINGRYFYVFILLIYLFVDFALLFGAMSSTYLFEQFIFFIVLGFIIDPLALLWLWDKISQGRKVKEVLEASLRDENSDFKHVMEILDLIKNNRYKVEDNFYQEQSDDSLEELARHGDIEEREALSRNRHLPEKFLKILAKDEESIVWMNIARRENLSEDIKCILAEKPDLPDNIKENYARDESILVRHSLSNNSSLNIRILSRLIEDDDVNVIKISIAHRETLPNSILKKLIQDPEEPVRKVIAGRPSLSNELLIFLANDLYVSVRKTIAKRKNLPVEVIEILQEDESEEIRYIINNK